MDPESPSAVTEAVFERWIEAFRGPLVGLIASWGADWGAAEELAVDTFAEAWIGRARFQGDPGDLGAAGAWLRGIASRLRSASRRKLRPVAMAPETLPAVMAEDGDPAGTGMEEERRELLAAAFAELKPEHQSVLRMKYLEETTAAQLAALMGISVRAAEGRLLQARRMLRVKVNRLEKQLRGREVKA